MTGTIVVIWGNDGTGKTSICKLINDKGCPSTSEGIIALERSSPIPDEFKSLNLKVLDNLTLNPLSDWSKIELPKTYNGHKIAHAQSCSTYNVVHIILDCSIEKITNRIKYRQRNPDEWETPKALFYYRSLFRSMASYFGIPRIDTTNMTLQEVLETVESIIECPTTLRIYNDICGNKLSRSFVNEHDIELILYNAILKHQEKSIAFQCDNIDMFPLYMKPILDLLTKENKVRIICQSIVRDLFNDCKLSKLQDHEFRTTSWPWSTIDWSKHSFVLYLHTEGESKKVYTIVPTLELSDFASQELSKLAIIVLKSTIYSHSMQSTGQIEGLGAIRGQGSRIFMEMMRRNGLSHAYHCISDDGVILSDFIHDVPPTEIVGKKYCEGTDKHSYYGMRVDHEPITNKDTGRYKNGLYIRFDWRNPNHIEVQSRMAVATSIPHYFLVEEIVGKDKFFETVLRNNPAVVPLGDKAIAQDLLENQIDTHETTRSAIKIFTSIDWYMNQIGLEVQDGCFMLNAQGSIFWSEINADCMRIRTLPTPDGQETKYDKDIWRAGGSSAKEQILAKWSCLNEKLMDYFIEHPFSKTEQLDYFQYPYQHYIRNLLTDKSLSISAKYINIFKKLAYPRSSSAELFGGPGSDNARKRVLVTMDVYNQKPVLVKSGIVQQAHHNSVDSALLDVIYPDLLVVDLNGAIDRDRSVNKSIIHKLGESRYIHTGGGITTLEDIQELLSKSVRRIVIGSNLQESFLQAIPKERLIVELSVDEDLNVLTHGRKTNSKIHIIDRINYLIAMKVKCISITFHATEGHGRGLPRQSIFQLMSQVPPRAFEKIFIGGGITTVDDLNYLWSFRDSSIIPVLGSALWNGTITMGDAYVAMTNFDDNGYVTACIQNESGIPLAVVHMNDYNIRETCRTRLLWTNDVIYGGFEVLQISHNCDGTSLLITVNSGARFCHTGSESCFNIQTSAKAGIRVLEDHVHSRQGTSSYTGQMQKHAGIPLAKMLEEYWEIIASNDRHLVQECADFLVHFLMYIGARNVHMTDILNVLNARRWTPQLLSSLPKIDNNYLYIAIPADKYVSKVDEFANSVLGFTIVRPKKSRSLTIHYNITDESKFKKHFGDKLLRLVPSRPKDATWMTKIIHGVIGYNTVIDNQADVFQEQCRIVDDSIELALIQRSGEIIDPTQWTPKSKAIIATEHVNCISRYFDSLNIDQDCYTLMRVVGSSESYMVNMTEKFTLCDAIVSTGQTLKDNNLEIYKTILPRGSITVGLYFRRFPVVQV